MEFSHGTFFTRFVKLASVLVLCSTAMTFSQFSCSFQSITETACSYDRLDKSRSLEIISLRNCSKNITDHCSYWSFPGVNTERELILARVSFSARKRLQHRNWTPFAHITGVNSGLVGGVTLLSAVYPKYYPNMEQIEKQIGVFPKQYPKELLRQRESLSQLDQVGVCFKAKKFLF